MLWEDRAGTPASGEEVGASSLVSPAWIVCSVEHSSWVLFEHLALSFKYWQVQGALPDECWGVLLAKARLSLFSDSWALSLTSPSLPH